MKQTRLVLVGGFLGAGKTTLIWQAAQRLLKQGKRVGLITNDQAPMLVDTALLAQAGLTVEEIAGGCFCCRFSELVDASDRLIERLQPDVLIGEPVGSCTDLSATVLQPLKERYASRFRVAPFSVLADPDRLREALDPSLASALHPSARYILRKQLEEADLVLLNKADCLSPAEAQALCDRVEAQLPATPVLTLSALEGAGVDAWLERVLQDAPAGRRIVDVDYDVYAEGEAVLGWLNATVQLTARAPVAWEQFARDFLASIQAGAAARAGEIAHLKLLLAAPGGQIAANVTRGGGEVAVRGALPAGTLAAELTINARVQMAPADLRALVLDRLQAATGDGITPFVTRIQELSPGRPQPTYRYAAVVGGQQGQ